MLVRRLGWIVLFLVLALLLFVIVGVTLGWGGNSLWPILGAAIVLIVVSFLLLRESKREQSDFAKAQSMEGGAAEPSEGEDPIHSPLDAAATNERRR